MKNKLFKNKIVSFLNNLFYPQTGKIFTCRKVFCFMDIFLLSTYQQA